MSTHIDRLYDHGAPGITPHGLSISCQKFVIFSLTITFLFTKTPKLSLFAIITRASLG